MATNRIEDVVHGEHLVPIPILAGATGLSGRPVRGWRQYASNMMTARILGTIAGTGIDLTLQDSDPPKVATPANIYNNVDDGSAVLKPAGGANEYLAIPFLAPINMTVFSIKLMLSKLGAPAAGSYIQAHIEGDAPGSPDSVPLTGLVANGNADPILCSEIAITYPAEHEFKFVDGIDLTAATLYWLVLEASYAASDANHIRVHYNTVGGTSGCMEYGGVAWAALATGNQDLWFKVLYCVFTDTAVVINHLEADMIQFDDRDYSEVIPRATRDTLRVKADFDGNTWVLNFMVVGGFPPWINCGLNP